MTTLPPAHDAVLALLDWLPEDTNADAVLVAHLLGVPKAEASRLLDELEDAGCVTSAMGALQ
jgi:DNA-binding IclR family transcriptional regulator